MGACGNVPPPYFRRAPRFPHLKIYFAYIYSVITQMPPNITKKSWCPPPPPHFKIPGDAIAMGPPTAYTAAACVEPKRMKDQYNIQVIRTDGQHDHGFNGLIYVSGGWHKPTRRKSQDGHPRRLRTLNSCIWPLLEFGLGHLAQHYSSASCQWRLVRYTLRSQLGMGQMFITGTLYSRGRNNKRAIF